MKSWSTFLNWIRNRWWNSQSYLANRLPLSLPNPSSIEQVPSPEEILQNPIKLIHYTRKIFLKVRQDVLTHRLGNYKSIFKGNGWEWEDFRPYLKGDDVRRIDWKMTARRRKPYVRIMTEERELCLYLLVDIGSSCRSLESLIHIKKYIRFLEICALLSMQALNNNNRISWILFNGNQKYYQPPTDQRTSGYQLLRSILSAPLTHTPSFTFEDAVNLMMGPSVKPGLSIILSDFWFLNSSSPTIPLLTTKHETLAIQIISPLEQAIPAGLGISLKWANLPTSPIVIPFWSTERKLAYKTMREKQLQIIQQIWQKTGSSFLRIQSDHPYLASLYRFLGQHASLRYHVGKPF